jgi:SPP1 gp7 family putative phage head morphogenesis protein
VDQDVFGLVKVNTPVVYASSTGGRVPTGLPGPKAYQFQTSQDKVASFMGWLKEQTDAGILQVSQFKQLGQAANSAWTDKYIEDTYKRGVTRARYELGKAGFKVPTLSASGGIQASMNTPFHMDRVGLLYSRTFQELKGVTAAMDSQVSRILAQSMADGDGPRDMARKIVNTIQGPTGELGITDTLGRFIPAKRRAEMIARTEVIRAHHAANVQEYRNWAVAGVRIQAEFTTAGDGRVCPECAALQGKIYTLDEVEGLIPRHTLCRCIALPTLPEGMKVDNTPLEEGFGTVEWKGNQELQATREDYNHIHGIRGYDNLVNWEQDKYFADGRLNKEKLDLLNQEEKVAIFRYTGGEDINEYIQGVLDKRVQKNAVDESFRKILNDALVKSGKYEGTVYRGSSIPDVTNRYKIGNIVKEQRFVSASKEESFAKGWANSTQQSSLRKELKNDEVIFTIKSQTGVDLNGLTLMNAEDEVLFSQNSRFKVITHTIDRQGVHLVTMEEIIPTLKTVEKAAVKEVSKAVELNTLEEYKSFYNSRILELSNKIENTTDPIVKQQLQFTRNNFKRSWNKSRLFNSEETQQGIEKAIQVLKVKDLSELQRYLGGDPILGMLVQGKNIEYITNRGYFIREFLEEQKMVTMDSFIVSPHIGTNMGTGTMLFTNQVRQFSKDYKTLLVLAEKSTGTNGYYTWARLGYEFEKTKSVEYLRKLNDLIAVKHPINVKAVKSLQELMTTPAGREFWKTEGFEFTGTFDLTENSLSRKLLNRYIQERGKI